MSKYKNKIPIACVLYFGMVSFSLSFDNKDLIKLKETGDCVGCDLKNSDLGGLNLKGANLEGASLKGAILIGTDLSYSNLLKANLSSAFIRSTNLCNTVMPDGLVSKDGCSNDEMQKH